MIIETDEVVLMGENEDLAASLVGGIWLSFRESIPEPQARILIEGFNLIILSEPGQAEMDDLTDDDRLAGRVDSLLPGMITQILVDDATTTAIKKMAVFELITNNIIETLTKMGFTLNDDEATHERLPEMNKILSFFYDMQQYEDIIGIAPLLESQDIPQVDRFLLAMTKYLGENADLDAYELLLSDVSEVTLKAIRDGLELPDDSEGVPDAIIQRIRANSQRIEGTKAYQHVILNGQIGGPLDSYMEFFKSDLAEVFQSNDSVQYAKELAAVYLISDLNTHAIKKAVLEFMYTVITDVTALHNVEMFMNGLVLDNDQT